MTNHTVAGIEVYLQAVDTKKVYLDLESIGAGAHATARVTLGSGRYRFVCLPADADPVRGPTVDRRRRHRRARSSHRASCR